MREFTVYSQIVSADRVYIVHISANVLPLWYSQTLPLRFWPIYSILPMEHYKSYKMTYLVDVNSCYKLFEDFSPTSFICLSLLIK